MPKQTVRQCVLEYQHKHHLPDYVMCNILCMDETEWQKFAYSHGFALTTFQKIVFIIETKTALPD